MGGRVSGCSSLKMSDGAGAADRQVPVSIPGGRRTGHLQDGEDGERGRSVNNLLLSVYYIFIATCTRNTLIVH